MMRTVNASEWSTHLLGYLKNGEPDPSYKVGEKRSVVLDGDWPEGHAGFVEIEVRCPSPVAINGITDNGESILLSVGEFALFKGRLVGFSGFEVVATENFSVRLASQRAFVEVPDPVPHTVIQETGPEDALKNRVFEYMREYMKEANPAKLFETEDDIREFVEDVFEGDHEFEEDEHGLPSMRGYEEDDEEPVEAPQEPADEPAEPPADKAAPKAGPKKKGGGAPLKRRSREADSPDDDPEDEEA